MGGTVHHQSLVLNRRCCEENNFVEKDIAHQFGEYMRNLRINRNLTQEELAGRSEISLKYIQRIEGKKPPNLSLGKLQGLAKGFGVPLWELLKFK
ncbi:MAG: helix-turn-helix transcriptional regulator [Candidatus Gracilibacteria bacterium]